MPTAVTEPPSHPRRPSMQSQSSLSDHTRPRRPSQAQSNPSHQLPPTAYSYSTPQLLEQTDYISRLPVVGGTDNDPDDFYRAYGPSMGDSGERGLHQNALHATNLHEEIIPFRARKSSAASTQSQDRHALRNSKSLGGQQKLSQIVTTKSNSALGMRKSSFKDLVARFDASPDDVPPVPVFPDAISGSRKTSPVLTMAAQGNTWKHAASASTPRSMTNQPPTQTMKKPRPLFGEIVPGSTSTSGAGYGILNPRRRRGSEGSPMHSPNPMFADDQHMDFTSSPFPYHSATTQPPTIHEGHLTVHRRATSEVSPTRHYADQRTEDATHQPRVEQAHQRRMSSSRIPVSTRRMSLDSGSGNSTPSSRAPSKAGHYASVQSSTTRSKLATPSTVGSSRNNPAQVRSAPAIRSPGKRGKAANSAQGQKSPLLRANIIAPPPKISPPLRSSRPRLPVSSATTAASRARIAERFQTMAKEQNDKRSTSRTKPSELSDIDLKARRLKITQALTKSREGQDLKGGRPRSNRTSRSGTPAFSDAETASGIRNTALPAVVVETPSFTNDDDVFTTPDENFHRNQDTRLTQEVLDSMAEHHDFTNDADSPTLGQMEHGTDTGLPRLDIPRVQTLHSLEEDSAVTQNTAETIFDDEDNQVESYAKDHDRPSLYEHVQNMREPTSASPASGISPSDAHTLDRADVESVNIILRNTTYMDEDEAVAKGYRNFMQPPPLPDLYEGSSNGQASWTSSIAERSENGEIADANVVHAETLESTASGKQRSSSPVNDNNEIHDITRATTASDAYTIVNIVLQERSASGIVDQELVDDIYTRIIEEDPELAQQDSVDPGRVEDLCLQSLAQYALEQDSPRITDPRQESTDSLQRDDEPPEDQDNVSEEGNELRPPPLPKDSLPPSSYRSGHKYKSSLDSVEDWADTSPSIGWLSYALEQSESEKGIKPSPLAHEAGQDDGEYGTVSILERSNDPPVPPKDDRPVLPAHSPPPPPISKTLPTGISSLSTPPEVPDRAASLAQMSSRPVTRESSNVAPSFTTQEEASPLAKQLKQRRHIMKEIVDTEFTYERDMRVLCDIYKQTAIAVLSEDDVKVIFGNVEEIQQFSKDFLTYLKQVTRPVYVMDRKSRIVQNDRNSERSLSPDLNDDERDRLTQVGVAFEASVNDMSVVYTEYIKSRHVANKRLNVLQDNQAVAEWLRECSENSKDITHAWSLDALSVKPIQRITKYPLLLASLLEATPADHPDIEDLRRALTAVTEINFRINDIKKQTEIVDQVLNRKRKESDVRNGLTKAFGRRAERLRQHVGVSEVYEDGEFSRLKMDYDNNGVHLLIVTKDIQGYLDSIKGWVLKITEMAAAAEAWVDVGHSSHPEAESKLRHLGSAVRGINTIALPDHIDLVTKKAILPLESAMVMIERFKSDPKGLFYKRDKKILDYSTARNKKDRGEKLDRKLIERLEQWEAINTEVKQRMRRLLEATQTLVHSCLQNLVHLHMSWLSMIRQKLSSAMAIDLDKIVDDDLIREWQVDFDYHEATALSLSICNGTLLAEAINLVSFLSPSTTMTGDDSPRQPSYASGKRSTSMHSDVSHPHYQSSTRYSSGQHSANDFPSETSSFGVNSTRMRATSTTSGQMQSRISDAYTRTPSSGQGFSRPATSLGQSERPSDTGSIKSTTIMVPRVSLDAPSPSIGPIAPLGTPNRPESAATFFSATGGPSNSSSQHIAQPSTASQTSTIVDLNGAGGSGGTSSIFSSAMPLSDSPSTEHDPNSNQTLLPPPGISSAGNVDAGGGGAGGRVVDEPPALFTVASVYAFNIDRARTEGGIPYLTYVAGEIFDVIGERGELWLARNQDDPGRLVGWIWCKHFAKLAT